MNEKIIKIFSELCLIHTVLENKYEAQSYKKIVNILKKYPNRIKNSSDLKNVEGIGNRTLLKIDEIINTGKLKLLEDMKKDKTIKAKFELQKVMGIGPKLSKNLVDKGITNIKQLEKAHKKGDIELTHMQQIGLKYFDTLNTKIPRNEITIYKNNIEKNLKQKFPDVEVHMAGSYRKGKTLSGDIDIILTTSKIKTKYELSKSNIFDDILAFLIEKKLIISIINKSSNNFMGITNTKRHIDIKMTPFNLLPFYQLYFGSGESFSRDIRQKVKDQGYKLSEFGIYKGNKIVMNKAKNEKEIFNKLGIKYIKPENR